MAKRKELEDRICPVCGNQFAPKRKDNIYCDILCANKAANKRKNEQNKELVKKQPVPKRKKSKPTDWGEVAKICKAHGITYGQAVARGLI